MADTDFEEIKRKNEIDRRIMGGQNPYKQSDASPDQSSNNNNNNNNNNNEDYVGVALERMERKIFPLLDDINNKLNRLTSKVEQIEQNLIEIKRTGANRQREEPRPKQSISQEEQGRQEEQKQESQQTSQREQEKPESGRKKTPENIALHNVFNYSNRNQG